jgi:hypothetical protein
MDFYRFWKILNENKNEWKRFPEPPDSPPEYHGSDWEDKDLRWSDWEEDGVTVRLVSGHFVDSRNRPLPFLDEYADQVQNWDQTHGISLDWSRMLGTLPGLENPRTGAYRDDEDVRIELDKLALSDYKNHTNRIELPDSFIPNIKAHFFRGYE